MSLDCLKSGRSGLSAVRHVAWGGEPGEESAGSVKTLRKLFVLAVYFRPKTAHRVLAQV